MNSAINNAWIYFKRNWRSNTISVVSFIYAVPQVYAAFQAWNAGQQANWHVAATSLVIAALAYVVKDAKTHSTQLEIAASTAAVVGSISAPALAKAADDQIKAPTAAGTDKQKP